MKTSKMFTIDVEIAQKLDNINASALTNRLLKEYFDLKSDKNTLIEEKKAVFNDVSKKKNFFLKKLGLLMNGIALILIDFLKCGSELGRGMYRRTRYGIISLQDTLTLKLRSSKKHLN